MTLKPFKPLLPPKLSISKQHHTESQHFNIVELWEPTVYLQERLMTLLKNYVFGLKFSISLQSFFDYFTEHVTSIKITQMYDSPPVSLLTQIYHSKCKQGPSMQDDKEKYTYSPTIVKTSLQKSVMILTILPQSSLNFQHQRHSCDSEREKIKFSKKINSLRKTIISVSTYYQDGKGAPYSYSLCFQY